MPTQLGRESEEKNYQSASIYNSRISFHTDFHRQMVLNLFQKIANLTLVLTN